MCVCVCVSVWVRVNYSRALQFPNDSLIKTQCVASQQPLDGSTCWDLTFKLNLPSRVSQSDLICLAKVDTVMSIFNICRLPCSWLRVS